VTGKTFGQPLEVVGDLAAVAAGDVEEVYVVDFTDRRSRY